MPSVIYDNIEFRQPITFAGDAASAAHNTYTLCVFVDTIVSATGRVCRVVVPPGGGGTVIKVDAVCDAAIADSFVLFTGKIGSTAITNGEVRINSGSAAGTVGTATPTAARSVAAGDVLRCDVGGGNTAAGRATVTFTIART
jgi:hypothetical protein